MYKLTGDLLSNTGYIWIRAGSKIARVRWWVYALIEEQCSIRDIRNAKVGVHEGWIVEA